MCFSYTCAAIYSLGVSFINLVNRFVIHLCKQLLLLLVLHILLNPSSLVIHKLSALALFEACISYEDIHPRLPIIPKRVLYILPGSFFPSSFYTAQVLASRSWIRGIT